ncbi:MAG: type I methionyl aminopeptidase [Chloroflexota bacterium]
MAVIELKSEREIGLMRDAGRVVARTLSAVQGASAVGVSLSELDRVAQRTIRAAGGRPTFLHYHPSWAPTPYPAAICTSLNDVVIHGIPDRSRLCEGDLVSIDCAVHLHGFCADAAISYTVGRSNPEAEHLIELAAAALAAGIAAARPDGRLGDIAGAIEHLGRDAGCGIPRDFGGHGIGRQMHEDPSVANIGQAGTGMRLKPGLVLALEPMFMAGGDDRCRVGADGWTIRTVDGSLAAHVEHTVAITASGPLVLTTLEES